MIRELRGKRLIGYALGNLGIALVNIFTGTFIFQYYVYTINLSSVYTSVGLTLNFVLIAVFSIIFGVIVDNKKPTKRGKRKKFLLFGIPFWFLANIFLWIPPWYCPQTNSFFLPVALYFWLMISLKAIFGTLIFTTYLSMLPEQSQTVTNRKSIASLRTIFLILASVLALLMPLVVQSLLENPEDAKWWQPSGKTIISLIPSIGFAFALLGSIMCILTYFSVDESFHDFKTYESRTNLKEAFKNILNPLTDKNYSRFLTVQLFISIAGKCLGTLVIPLLIYVLLFHDSDFFIYIFVSIGCKGIAYIIWMQILKKKRVTLKYSLCIFTASIAAFLILFYLFPIQSFTVKVILFIFSVGTILGAMYAFPLFSIPLGAAIVQEAAEKTNKPLDEAFANLSGSYYGALNFMNSIGQALGSLLIGFILVGPNEEDPFVIILLSASIGLFYLISVLCLRYINLSLEIKA